MQDERPRFPPEDALPPLAPLDASEVDTSAMRHLAAAVLVRASRDAIAGEARARAELAAGAFDLWVEVLFQEVDGPRERLLAGIDARVRARQAEIAALEKRLEALQARDESGATTMKIVRLPGRRGSARWFRLAGAEVARDEPPAGGPSAGSGQRLTAGQRALAAARRAAAGTTKAAEAWNVNRNYVRDARRLLTAAGAGDLVAQVQAGALPFHTAMTELKARRAAKAGARALLRSGVHPGAPGWHAGRGRARR